MLSGTTLISCASPLPRLDFIEELLLSGANPNVKDNLKQSGYDIARFYNQDGVVDKLFPSTTETRAAGAV